MDDRDVHHVRLVVDGYHRHHRHLPRYGLWEALCTDALLPYCNVRLCFPSHPHPHTHRALHDSVLFAELPTTRSYQLKLLNAGAVASVAVNGNAVPYNRFGKTVSGCCVPSSSYKPSKSGVDATIVIVGRKARFLA